MKNVIFAIAAAAVVASGSAVAQQGWYAGLGAGQSNTSFNTSDYSFGLAAINESQDKTQDAWKVFTGFNFTQNWAIEGGYADLGTAKYKYSGTGILTGLSGAAKDKETSWFLEGKGTVPLNDQFNLFGKVGVTWNKLELTGSTNNALVNALAGLPWERSKTTSGVVYGVGGEYNLNKQVAFRLEYEDFGKFGGTGNSTGRTTADLWTADVVFKF